MAFYATDDRGSLDAGTMANSAWSTEFKPREEAPCSGIYCCKACAREIVAAKGDALPERDHHKHANHEAIRWRLLVRAKD